MASAQRGASAPTTIQEGLQGISVAINAAMMAPDAGQHLQLLESLQKVTLGALHGGRQGQQQPGQGAQQPQRPGVGGLGGLQGQPPGPPSAGMGGGPSPSGISSDDLRRQNAQMIGAPG